jgi:Mobilization protein NikA
MDKRNRLKVLTATASAHLAQDEEARVRQRAAEAGLSKSEWCRQVILSALDTPLDAQLLLSEFLALRTLVLALHTEALQGNKITEQRLGAIIQHAEAKKFAMAENRIRAFQSNRPPNNGR